MATDAIKKCKKCGTEYLAFAWRIDKFCTGCGEKLPKQRQPERCSCGEEIKEGNKFCFYCGKEVIKKIKK